jgi:hypothetical protein
MFEETAVNVIANGLSNTISENIIENRLSSYVYPSYF